MKEYIPDLHWTCGGTGDNDADLEEVKRLLDAQKFPLYVRTAVIEFVDAFKTKMVKERDPLYVTVLLRYHKIFEHEFHTLTVKFPVVRGDLMRFQWEAHIQFEKDEWERERALNDRREPPA